MGRGRPEPASRKPDGRYDKDSRCFIATAVYGDQDSPQVLTLRGWRNDRLSSTSLGRAVIQIYYITSPPIARTLLRSPRLAAIVRTALDQFVIWVGSRPATSRGDRS